MAVRARVPRGCGRTGRRRRGARAGGGGRAGCAGADARSGAGLWSGGALLPMLPYSPTCDISSLPVPLAKTWSGTAMLAGPLPCRNNLDCCCGLGQGRYPRQAAALARLQGLAQGAPKAQMLQTLIMHHDQDSALALDCPVCAWCVNSSRPSTLDLSKALIRSSPGCGRRVLGGGGGAAHVGTCTVLYVSTSDTHFSQNANSVNCECGRRFRGRCGCGSPTARTLLTASWRPGPERRAGLEFSNPTAPFATGSRTPGLDRGGTLHVRIRM